MKKAFIVIVDYKPNLPEPHIGDIHWALLDQHWRDSSGWGVHVTEATPEMLAHHGIPYPVTDKEET